MLRVLMATDLSPNADLALSRAISVAAQHGASLRIIHVAEGAAPDDDCAPIGRRLEARCKNEAPPDLEVEVGILHGEPLPAILDAAEAFEPDLIVIGGHARMRLRDAWLGTTATQLLRRANAPVLVVRTRAAGPYRRVLAALEDSTAAEDVLRLAARLATAQEVFAVHAFNIPLEAYVGHRALYRDIEEDHRMVIEDIVERVAPSAASVHFHQLVEEGDVFRVLEHAVKEIDPDLLVLGTHGRGLLAGLMFDSIAEAALACFELDMLVLRTREGEPLSAL